MPDFGPDHLPDTEPGPILQLEGFEGPLDLLLDLARRQKVDLARISILSLVEQFLALVEGVRLELAADWLVMAAWLAWLKSRLLLPPDTEEAADAGLAADVLAARLRDLQAIRAGAAWLAAPISIVPPIELPMKCALPTPTALRNAVICSIRLPNMSSNENSFSVLPKPSQSGANTWKCSASAARLNSQVSSAQPPNSPLCSSTSTGPDPASR